MKAPHPNAVEARLPGFLRFIETTVGAEAQRVAEVYEGSSGAVSAFLEAIPDLCADRIPRQIDFRWWGGDKIKLAQIYTLEHPSVLVFHAAVDAYDANGPVPDIAGLDFEIVVLYHHDKADQTMMPGDPWERPNRRVWDDVLGALVCA